MNIVVSAFLAALKEMSPGDRFVAIHDLDEELPAIHEVAKAQVVAQLRAMRTTTPDGKERS